MEHDCAGFGELIPAEHGTDWRVSKFLRTRRNSSLAGTTLRRVALSPPSRLADQRFAGAFVGVFGRVIRRDSLTAGRHGVVWAGGGRAVPLRKLRLRVCVGHRVLDALLLPHGAPAARVGDFQRRDAAAGG